MRLFHYGTFTVLLLTMHIVLTYAVLIRAMTMLDRRLEQLDTSIQTLTYAVLIRAMTMLDRRLEQLDTSIQTLTYAVAKRT